MRIGSRVITRDKWKNPFLIAEIGVNYYEIAAIKRIPPIEAAKEMILAAIKAGADAVKLQTYKAEKLVIKNSPAYWDTNKEPTKTQYELFKKYDKLSYDDYIELAKFTRKKHGLFLTTLFDEDGYDIMAKYLPAFKIASADITNKILLNKAVEYKKPLIISTGASTMYEILETYNYLRGQDIQDNDIAFLHCVLEYPTNPKNANINRIKRLLSILPKDVVVGYSDHVPPDRSMLTLTLSAIMGSSIIEKHFTIDKKLKGNDHYHAMDPQDILTFKNNMKLLRRLLSLDEIDYISVEETARKHARRGLVAKENIKRGGRVENKITAKRPQLGIDVSLVDLVEKYGVARKNIKKGDPIRWTDIKIGPKE